MDVSRLEQDGASKVRDMISVLLSRLYPDARRIDGRGGDGGRDVQIVDGQDGSITCAFELKSFIDRMNAVRRRQVERSLKRAASLEPARWILVVPIDPTPAEDNWFRRLSKGCSFPTECTEKHGLTKRCRRFQTFDDTSWTERNMRSFVCYWHFRKSRRLSQMS